MNITQTIEQTIARLQHKLNTIKWVESQGKKGGHANSCPMEDPESYAPCNCGYSDELHIKRTLVDLINKHYDETPKS